MSSFLDRLIGRQRRREQSLDERWRKAVAAIASGKAPPEEQVEALLAEANRTVEDLRAAVERFSRRQAAKDAVERGRLAEAEKQRVHSQLLDAEQAHAAALDAAAAKFRQVAGPLQERLASLEQLRREGVAAEALLREGADAEAVAAVAAAQEKLQAARVRRDQPLKEAHRSASTARALHGKLDPRLLQPLPTWQRAEVEAKLHQAEQGEAEALALAESLGKDVAAAEAAVAAAEEQLLEVP
jgi:hypothetical protein